MGGYYDAGDNVKFGLPMAFTITTLAWSAINYKQELQASGELKNVINGIRWGTDYFLKASTEDNKLWVEVKLAESSNSWSDFTNVPCPNREVMAKFGWFLNVGWGPECRS